MTHTSTEQPVALIYATTLRSNSVFFTPKYMGFIADELERLHARVQELEVSQAQRVPLSDEQIDEYVKHADMHGRYAEPFARGVRWGIRHYERAHDITNTGGVE